MKEEFRRNVSVRGSEAFTGITLKEPMSTAAGLMGIKAAMDHAFKEMGVIRSFRALSPRAPPFLLSSVHSS